MTEARLATGAAGERATLQAYRRRGYRLVARNWRCAIGELDLVLARGPVLVICEVKSRRGRAFGDGWEAVDARKRRKVRAVTAAFLQVTAARPAAIRFDVASVRLAPDGSAEVEVFEDAF
jgi:putative endonuclease